MQTVYIWKNRAQTGHASLHLDGEDFDEYLSYHPPIDPGSNPLIGLLNVAVTSLVGGLDPQKNNGFQDGYDTDFGKYGYPVEQIELSCLDMNSMKEFIDELYNKEHHHLYNLYTENCSTTVGICLLKGFSKLLHDSNYIDYFRGNYEYSGLSRALSHYGAHSHSKIAKVLFDDLPYEFAKTRVPAAQYKRAAKIIFAIFATLKGAHSVVWTPDDVCRFARYIESVEKKI